MDGSDLTGIAAPADDTIAAIRVVRGILDAEPGPWQVPPTAIRGAAIVLINVMKTNAVLLGYVTEDEQLAHIREGLAFIEETATLLALTAENRAAGD